MSLPELRACRLVYVATPYTKYKQGLGKAWEHACVAAGYLIEQGIKVFSPIAHSHAIAKLGEIDPLDHGIWLSVDEPIMDAADALVIVKLDGFDESFGVDYEKDVFEAAEKPIYELDPNTMQIVRLKPKKLGPPSSTKILIGFTGKPESGKSTAARYLSEKHGLPWINVGDAMKEMLRGLYEMCDVPPAEVARRLYGDLKEKPDPLLNGKEPRYAMQTIGFEWRDLISPMLFVDRWGERVVRAGGSAVADGMRHKDEQSKFKELGGILVHVVRPGQQDVGGDHPAEKLQLDPDVTIVNDGTVEEFLAKVDNLVTYVTNPDVGQT